MFFVIFNINEYKRLHSFHDNSCNYDISDSYITHTFSDFESMNIDVDLSSLYEILEKIYNILIVCRNTKDIHIPIFISKRIHFIVFEFETEEKNQIYKFTYSKGNN